MESVKCALSVIDEMGHICMGNQELLAALIWLVDPIDPYVNTGGVRLEALKVPAAANPMDTSCTEAPRRCSESGRCPTGNVAAF